MLLFFDIDGTLFDDERRMPASVRPALEQARQNGHSLFVNTGRTLCNMDRRLDGFPFDGWIMGCGTRILLHGETLQAMEYDPESSLKLLNLFRAVRMPAVYECDTAMYFDPEGAPHPAVPYFRRFAEDHGLARDITEGDPEFRIVKMFVFSDRPEPVQHLCSETGRLGMPYTAIDRGKGGWEIIPAGYSKASGIDRICRELGATTEECFAFGDSRNDLSMLLHVKYSIAMGNAPDDVKAQCFHVTERPENDGIAVAMKHFGLI
jgi:Cof subfamily protein (haloacid dehalogenase superfamily)